MLNEVSLVRSLCVCRALGPVGVVVAHHQIELLRCVRVGLWGMGYIWGIFVVYMGYMGYMGYMD
jgi:hypothetical protein